jgi:ABC-type spermidine/putrescine transport system permease subunit I
VIEVQFNAVGNWPLGAALSLVSMAMVAVIAGLFVAAARAATKAVR